MAVSRAFGSRKPGRAHLLRGGGHGKEIMDLRNDVEEAFAETEAVSIRAVTAAATLLETDEILEINTTAGAVPVTLPPKVLNSPRTWMLVKTNAGANTFSLLADDDETISGAVAAGVPTGAAATTFPGWTLYRNAAGNYRVV